MKNRQQFQTVNDKNGRRQWKSKVFTPPTPEMAQPVKRKMPDAVKPVECRKEGLKLDANVGKSVIVAKEGTGGFSCDICGVQFNDSMAYLTHLNGKDHHRMDGKTMTVYKQGVDKVKQKLEQIKIEKEKRDTQQEVTFEDIEKKLEDEEREDIAKRKDKKSKKVKIEPLEGFVM
jgi:U4/U6.U5 tri-snRNP component SNU23